MSNVNEYHSVSQQLVYAATNKNKQDKRAAALALACGLVESAVNSNKEFELRADFIRDLAVEIEAFADGVVGDDG